MKRVLVCGAGGFIGGHLVKKLKAGGCWVRGVDIKEHEFAPTQADEFLLADLRDIDGCCDALDGCHFDEVYQLAADMGGMGFIHSAECEIMHNSALINANMIRTAALCGVGRYFFSSSVCVYPDMEPGAAAMAEHDVYPAMPDNEYGWEKLYAERMALAYGRQYPMKVRIARFENTYGPEGTWQGGREKAPAALCRKAAQAKMRGANSFEVWGDGAAVRSYTWIGDLTDGIIKLMRSDLGGPVNLGSSEYVTVRQLVGAVVKAAGVPLWPEWTSGPVGVQSRNFSKARAESIGAGCETPLRDGIACTYAWIEEQVKAAP